MSKVSVDCFAGHERVYFVGAGYYWKPLGKTGI